mmetsp:Transcript_153924/g.272987  ORF Transcript_153924/g.272987 Transcript_153924/m.272987 type:complete len:274 (-) Transcript_153924:119-940(-)
MAAYSPLIFCFAAVSIHNLQTDAATLSRQQELHQDGSHSHAMMRREQNAGTPSKDHIKFRARDRVDEILKNGGKIKNAEKINLCNDQYEEGTKDSNDCAQTWQVPIDSETVCQTAAELSCPDTGSGHSCLPAINFKVPYENQTDFPSGCSIRSNDSMWIYNPTGIVPTAPVGTPICIEKEYTNGTAGSASECPEKYSVIADEDWCRSAANCLNYLADSEFRILDETEQDKYPKGCFLKGENVGFNPKSADPSCSPDGTPCVGIPLCNISHPSA